MDTREVIARFKAERQALRLLNPLVTVGVINLAVILIVVRVGIGSFSRAQKGGIARGPRD